jgi:LysR family transcriptional regulator, nitrogen assimilation regulatory protein
MLTLRQLRYFVAVIDAGSLTQAAASQHVAATALSMQMKALEESLGTPLIRRHSRGIEPTEAGVQLYEQASRILTLVTETKRLVTGQEGEPARTVSMGVPPGLARIVGVEAFLGAPARLKRVNLDIAEGWTVDLARRLEAGELDLVVGYGLESSEAVEVTELFEDRLVFLSGRRGTEEGPITLAEALASKLVFYGEMSVGWQEVVRAARAGALPLDPELHVDSIHVWRELLRRGLGDSIAPYGVNAEEIHRGELFVRELVDAPRIRVSLGVRRKLLEERWARDLASYLVELVSAAKARFQG